MSAIEASDNAVSDTVSDTVSSVMRDSSEMDGFSGSEDKISSVVKSNQKKNKNPAEVQRRQSNAVIDSG